MSKVCVQAVARAAERSKRSIFLIASRRQVDADAVGGGYVERWTTEEYSEYVRRISPPTVRLARDHGGPYQGASRDFVSLDAAIDDAINSFQVDIDCGFDFLHVDTSVGPNGDATEEEAFELLRPIYTACAEYARSLGRAVEFEIGTEEQTIGLATASDTRKQLAAVKQFVQESNLPMPKFLVVQTGTKVVDIRNVGHTEVALQDERAGSTESALANVVKAANEFDVLTKAHNCDYLEIETISKLAQLGTGGINIAPEFGVLQTTETLRLLNAYGIVDGRDEYLRLAVDSQKWAKWVEPDREYTSGQLAAICGHYVYTHPDIAEITSELSTKLETTEGRTLEAHLVEFVQASVERYMKAANYL